MRYRPSTVASAFGATVGSGAGPEAHPAKRKAVDDKTILI